MIEKEQNQDYPEDTADKRKKQIKKVRNTFISNYGFRQYLESINWISTLRFK